MPWPTRRTWLLLQHHPWGSPCPQILSPGARPSLAGCHAETRGHQSWVTTGPGRLAEPRRAETARRGPALRWFPSPLRWCDPVRRQSEQQQALPSCLSSAGEGPLVCAPEGKDFSAPVPEQQLPLSPRCSSLHSPGGACGSSSGPRSEENCPSSGLSLGSCSRVRAQSSPNLSSCPSLPPVCALSPQETPAAAGSGEQEQGAAAVGELHPSPPWQRGRGRPWCGQRQEGDGGAPQTPSRQVGGGEGPMETFWQDSCSSAFPWSWVYTFARSGHALPMASAATVPGKAEFKTPPRGNQVLILSPAPRSREFFPIAVSVPRSHSPSSGSWMGTGVGGDRGGWMGTEGTGRWGIEGAG